MQDTLLSVASDAIKIIKTMGRKDVADILQNRIDAIMGWNHEQGIN